MQANFSNQEFVTPSDFFLLLYCMAFYFRAVHQSLALAHNGFTLIYLQKYLWYIHIPNGCSMLQHSSEEGSVAIQPLDGSIGLHCGHVACSYRNPFGSVPSVEHFEVVKEKG